LFNRTPSNRPQSFHTAEEDLITASRQTALDTPNVWDEALDLQQPEELAGDISHQTELSEPMGPTPATSQRLLFGFAALLLLVAGASFALSNLNPTKPVGQAREMLEPLPPSDYAKQLQPSVNWQSAMHLYRSETTRASDTVESLFDRLSIDDQEAERFIRSNAQLRKNLLSKSGRPVRVEVDDQNRVLSLKVLWSQSTTSYYELGLSRKSLTTNASSTNTNTSGAAPSSATPFELKLQTLPLHATMRVGSARIQSTLFSAADEAHIPDTVAAQLTDLFASEIDFHRHLKKGDEFTVLYEGLDADGEPMGYGKILGAEVVSNGTSHQLMYFKAPSAKEGGYFNLKGQSLKRIYLAAPLRYSRITSGYKMRFHPILQTWKAHQGIDYAAPTGTPVHTVGKGVVRTAGWMNGLGNVVFVDHGNSQTTVYAHLSQISVRAAQSVEQGQVIGAVGETGWATGPHLHFEFRINDHYKDPSTIARQSVPIVLSGAAMAQFKQQANALFTQFSRANAGEDQLSLVQAF